MVGNILETVIHRMVDDQRIDIAVQLAGDLVLADKPSCEVVIFRLCGVEPPGIDPVRYRKAVTETLYIVVGRFWIEEVDPVGPVDIVSALLQPLAERARTVDLGPYGYHETGVHCVQRASKRRRIRVMLTVELHGVPAGIAPPLPVLDYHVQGQTARAEAFGILKYLILGMIALAAMDVSEHPVGHLRHGAGQGTVGRDDFVRSAGEDSIVQGLCHGRAESGLVRDLAPIEDGIVAPDPFRCDGMGTRREGNYNGRSRRQPCVGHVNHRVSVDCEIVTAGHFLPDVKEQGVLPRLGNVYGGGKVAGPAHLTAVAGCTGGIDGHNLTVVILLGQSDAMVCRIKIRQTIIVPHQAIALARKDEGYGDLGIDLGQAAGQATDVQISVLELPGAVQMLVRRGSKSLGYSHDRHILD